MDQATTRESLYQLIQSRAYVVIALTGEWGVGKTHLWESLAREKDIRHGYVSLFGLKSASELKTRLASSKMRLDEKEGVELRRSWKSISASLANAIDRYSDSNGVVGATAMVVNDLVGDRIIERILTGAVVVLDDLERSDPSLDMAAVMGVIDELRRLKCQVVLILNEQQLDARGSCWSTYHEKVVDIQLALTPTPADAIDAVINMVTAGRREAIRDAWLEANCRNIRVAQRVIRADRTIFRDLDTQNIASLVSDTVFLTIAEARAFHKEADSVEVLSVLTGGARGADPKVRERRDAIRASSAVNFSIYRSFQEAVIEFLKTGHIDVHRWDQCISEAEQDILAGSERQKLHSWFEAALWDPTLSDEAARRTAQELLPEVWRLDPRNAQTFIHALKTIGSHDLVDAFVDAWIDGINRNRVLYSKDLPFDPIEPVDPRIFEALDELASVVHPRPPMIEALRRQAGRRDYRENDVVAINEATVDEWANLLLSSETKESFDLLYDLHRHGGIETQRGRTAMRAAVQRIHDQQPESKLARVILRSGLLPPSSLGDGPQSQPAELPSSEADETTT